MNFESLVQLRRLQPIESSENVYIAEIDPALASDLLALNFSDNRKLSKLTVQRFSSDMKEGRWLLGNDALTFNAAGRLVNGQHRLNAVVQSKTTQRFIILSGVCQDTAQILDMGQSRNMGQRITVSGVRISNRECAVIRHAMNDYTINTLGTAEFGHQRHDELVKNVFLKHKNFFVHFNVNGKSKNPFVCAAALRIYAEMTHYSAWHKFAHNMSPMERTQLWLDLVHLGFSQAGFSVGETERVAIILKNKKDNRKLNSKSGHWGDKECLQFTITAAHKFMLGQSVHVLSRYTKDPFRLFMTTPSTNAA
jgi:hypothetical protein